MFRLMKKDLFWFAVGVLVIFPLVIMAVILFDMQNSNLIMMQNILLLYLLSIGVLSIVEAEEDLHNGILLKRTLPVVELEIIGGKFLVSFVAITILATLMTAAGYITLPENLPATHAKLVATNYRYCLWLIGFIHIGSLYFGFINFMRFGIVGIGTVLFTLGVMAQFIYVRKFGMQAFITLVQNAGMKMMQINFWQSLLVTIGIYVLLFIVAYSIQKIKKD